MIRTRFSSSVMFLDMTEALELRIASLYSNDEVFRAHNEWARFPSTSDVTGSILNGSAFFFVRWSRAC